MRRALLGITLASALLWTAPAAAQSPPASARLWSSNTAFTIPQGRIEAGLFHPIRWGVTDDIELAAHPLLEIALPHLDAKIRWIHGRQVSLSTWHRLSYPTLFMSTFAREGTLGLLPANTNVPTILGLDTSFLVTVSAPDDRTHYTLELGLSVAPRLSDGDPIVLDFPFLYSRFGAASTKGTTYVGVAVNGMLGDDFAWQADLRLTSVPVVPHGYTLEHSASLAWHPGRGFGLSLGYRVVTGRYPVGVRTHLMPTFDVFFGF